MVEGNLGGSVRGELRAANGKQTAPAYCEVPILPCYMLCRDYHCVFRISGEGECDYEANPPALLGFRSGGFLRSRVVSVGVAGRERDP